LKLQAPGQLFVVGTDYRSPDNEVILPVGQGLLNRKGDPGAFLIAEINLSHSLERILSDTSDLKSRLRGMRKLLPQTGYSQDKILSIASKSGNNTFFQDSRE